MARKPADMDPKIQLGPIEGRTAKVAVARRMAGAAPPPPVHDSPAASKSQRDGETAAIEKLKKLHAENAARTAASNPGLDGATSGKSPPTGAVGSQGSRDTAPTDREAGLMEMLRIEGETRDARTKIELLALIANAPRRITRARQIFVVRLIAGRWQVVAISALPAVDRTSPLVRFIEHTVQRLDAEGLGGKPMEFRLSAYANADDEAGSGYPMQEGLWIPFCDRNESVFGGMLLTREVVWQERDIVIAARLGGAFQHAMQALEGRRPLWRRLRPSGKVRLALAIGVLALGFLPVSLTTLAPAEVVARAPFVVAAPIEGVIDDIPIAPNARVEPGTLLVKFDDTLLRNKYEIAEREVLVAEARLKTTTQLAFADERGRHDMAVARADLLLKTVERDFAKEMLAKTQIRAPRAGLAVLTDKKDLIGRPMTVGERILEIANPANVEVRIDVPVDDAIILRNGAKVKLLLDADPLTAIDARIIQSDYQARPSDANVLSFRAIAELTGDGQQPRLGGRGSAQIYGERVALAFYLLRRPFAKLRQWTGL